MVETSAGEAYGDNNLSVRFDLSGRLRARNPETSLADNPFRKEVLQWVDRTDVSLEDYHGLVDRFGYGFLDAAGISLIFEKSKRLGHRIIGIGSGKGYAEEQLAQAGCEVRAFDIRLPENPIFPALRLCEKHTSIASSYPDHALFISFPDRQKDGFEYAAHAFQTYREAGGALFILLGPPQCNHLYGPGAEIARIERELQPCAVVHQVTPTINCPGLAQTTAFFRMQTYREIPLTLRIYDLKTR